MRIRYAGIDGGLTRLTVHEFLQFSANVRAVLICENLVSFYDHRGRNIALKNALVELADTWNEEDDFGRAPTRPAPSHRRRKRVEHDERRRFQRHSMVVPVSVTGRNGRQVAFTENISEGGVLLRSSYPYRSGDRVNVQIPVAGTAEAVVIRSVERDEGCFTAVAFMSKYAKAA